MKIKTYFLHPLLFLVLIFSFAQLSCVKIKEDKIDGEWVRVKMWDIEPEYKEYWTFMDQIVTVEKEVFSILPDDSIPTLHRETIDYGSYSVSKTINRTYVHINDFTRDEYYTFNKKWQVIDLDKEIFSLATSAGTGLIYLEFYSE